MSVSNEERERIARHGLERFTEYLLRDIQAHPEQFAKSPDTIRKLAEELLLTRASRAEAEAAPAPAAAPDAGAPQENAEKKERPEPINTETLRNIRVWLATMKRLAAPPSAVDYVESLLNEVEYLRAYVPPPLSAPAAHQERTEPTLTLMDFRREVHDKLCVVRDGKGSIQQAIVHQQCLDFLSELYQRALGAPARAAEWQPPETAVDHERVLGCWEWDGQPPSYAIAARVERCWFIDGKVNGKMVLPPTHWMRFPLPPGALAGDSNLKT